MNTRRGFLQGSAGGALAALGVRGAPLPASAWSRPDSGSDIGSLYPFVKSQAVTGEFPLSFLQEEFSDLRAWKAKARAKVLELLHYAPPACDPRAEIVERVDCGDYVRGKGPLQHHARRARSGVRAGSEEGEGPAPAIVALHDHGGFYLWGKEKIVEIPDEHPALTDFKRQLYGGRSIATELARAGLRRGRRSTCSTGASAGCCSTTTRPTGASGPRASPPSASRPSTAAPASPSSSSVAPSTPPASPGRA